MFAKALAPGPHPLPALIATAADADALVLELTRRGWVPFGDPLPATATGQVVVGPDRLQLVLDGQALLDDGNPAAPDGWWAAVDDERGRCLVVVVRHEDVDLSHGSAGEQLLALVGTGRAVVAVLPVVVLLDEPVT